MHFNVWRQVLLVTCSCNCVKFWPVPEKLPNPRVCGRQHIFPERVLHVFKFSGRFSHLCTHTQFSCERGVVITQELVVILDAWISRRNDGENSTAIYPERCGFLPRCMECRRGLAMRFLSVHLSVKRMHCDKVEEKSVQIFIPYERYLV